MSGIKDPHLPLEPIETNREKLELIAESDLPIAIDAERTLELLQEKEGGGQ